MKDTKKQYWKGIEQLSNDPKFVKLADKEFAEYLPINEAERNDINHEGGSSRRDFLKMMGFGVAAASLAACEAPVRNAIPYLNKPVDVDPGVPNYYASTYSYGGDYASVIVKTREGRPIKLEGNKLSPITQGGVNAQVEASVLSMYDKNRLSAPTAGGTKTSWMELDKGVTSQLSAIASTGGAIKIVSNTVLSPSTKAVVADFVAQYPTAEHIMYDADSASGIMAANAASFGSAIIPSYDFSKADVIVSFAADFLGTWISPIEFTKQYSKTRKVGKKKKSMSRHFQFESNLSLSGANADYRTPVKPSQQGLLVANLYNLIAAMAGASTVSAAKVDAKHLKKAADELWAARGKSIVVSGSNDVDVQVMINAINNLLGNYGSTIDIDAPVYFRQGDDAKMASFVKDLKGGGVAGVIMLNANPVYDHPMGADIAAGLGKAKLSVAIAQQKDETSSLCNYVAADHHFLESWNDAEPKSGHYSLCQPAISPLFKTRQSQESLMKWAGTRKPNYYDYLRANWKANMHTSGDFDMFWDKCLYDGIFAGDKKSPSLEEGSDELVAEASFGGDVFSAASGIAKNYKAASTDMELVLYQKIAIGTGTHANNPWLQETPDPISKANWDNYVTVSLADAKKNKWKMDMGNTTRVDLTVNGKTVNVPVLVQPGQANGTYGLAVGYGRTMGGKVANGVGVNVYPMAGSINGASNFDISKGVSIADTKVDYQIAQTQTHQTYMGRATVVQETILSRYKKNPADSRFDIFIATAEGKKAPSEISLWKGHTYNNHHWGLVVDLNSCTGCSACSVACQAENNVPVVGRQEVLNRREMAWIRIDRYYSGRVSKEEAKSVKQLEEAADNPEVIFQPLMCQHCDNAPCETVCPVAATTHSTEGLNQMAYNRCIGTRYCANNCPYKVRRFNWFKYHDNKQFPENSSMNNDLGKMVLNPDVVVRARGVMEKCSLCVQRIQLGKLVAKNEKRRPTDDDIEVACAQACPADAMVFGDMNNPESKISKLLSYEEKERGYHMLEEIQVRPNVTYLAKVRNVDEEEA